MFVTGEPLRALQLVELEMLSEVDRICREADIPYVIIAGTLLGAVRHGGFIPWDDDADVAFLRKDYERFREACVLKMDRSRFWFQDHTTSPGYRWGYGKIRRKDSLFVRERQEHMPYEQGIFIDVFPIDCIPSGYMMRSLKNFECFLVRKILYAKAGKIAADSRVSRAVYRVLDRIPEDRAIRFYERLIRRAKTCEERESRKREKRERRGRRGKTLWGRILLFPTPNRAFGYHLDWYTERADYLFEGRIFPGIRDYGEYLTFKYGDYREYPPEKLQRPHAVSRFQLPADAGSGSSNRSRSDTT